MVNTIAMPPAMGTGTLWILCGALLGMSISFEAKSSLYANGREEQNDDSCRKKRNKVLQNHMLLQGLFIDCTRLQPIEMLIEGGKSLGIYGQSLFHDFDPN